MDIQSVLKHMSQYWEVYQYVAENGPSLMEDIKSYLIEQCHKPESTARGNISAIKDSPLFRITEGYVMLDDDAGLKLEEILEYIFEWNFKDARHTEIKELKENIKKAERRENSQKDAIVRIVDLQNEIGSDVNSLLEIKSQIVESIKMVTDPEGQVVLEERYLCYAKWEDIASELGYTVRQIFRVHDAALKEIVVPESCQ